MPKRCNNNDQHCGDGWAPRLDTGKGRVEGKGIAVEHTSANHHCYGGQVPGLCPQWQWGWVLVAMAVGWVLVAMAEGREWQFGKLIRARKTLQY